MDHQQATREGDLVTSTAPHNLVRASEAVEHGARGHLLHLQRAVGNQAVCGAMGARATFLPVQRAVIFDAQNVPVEVDDSMVGFGPDSQWRGPQGQILTRDSEGNFHETAPDQEPQVPQSSPPVSVDPGTASTPVGTPLTSTSTPATEHPMSMSVGGVPAFRYNFNLGPVAEADIETPTASVHLALTLGGSATVTFPNAPRGVSTDVDTGGWRVEALHAVGGVVAGVRVSGLGTASPGIGAVVGTEFTQTEVRFVPPSTMAFRGQARLQASIPSPLGPVMVQGAPSYSLAVTVTPRPPQAASSPVPATPPVPAQSEESWFEEHAGGLAAIGTIALVGAAIFFIPETGGGSLLLLGI